MKRNTLIWIAAAVVGLLACALLVWALLPQAALRGRHKYVKAINPALNIGYRYDGLRFKPAPYDAGAEFAFQLDGQPGYPMSLYGKRIAGIGSLLGKAPGAMLYDFVGTQYVDELVDNYKLAPQGEPRYEDIQLHGGLGLHQLLQYRRPDGRSWPRWFPAGLEASEAATLEGWVFFHGPDLFFFYAVSAAPLDEASRAACLSVVQSLQFEKAGAAAPDAAAAPAQQDEADGEAPPQDSASPQGGEAPTPPGKGLFGGE